MITVYKVQLHDEEGRSVVSTNYFLDQQDAYALAGLKPDGTAKNGRSEKATEIRVWEKGERTPENMEREEAIQKLTPRQRELLGIKM
jgi:hypothetical protein